MRSDHGICEQMVDVITECMAARHDMHPSVEEQLRQTVDMLRITDVMVCCSEDLLRDAVTEDQYLQNLAEELEGLQGLFLSKRYGGRA